MVHTAVVPIAGQARPFQADLARLRKEVTLSSDSGLRAWSDSELLARLGALPRDGKEREAVCEVLVSRYTSLVRACVGRYRRSPEPAEDLLQVGYVGLLKAINNFDPRSGESLGAYAAPCISGELKRHFRDRRWQVRVRRRDQELLLEMRTAEETLTQQLGRIPDDHQLACYIGVPDDDVLEARQAHQSVTVDSLDAPLSADHDSDLLGDLLGQGDAAVSHALDMQAVYTHLDELPERQQRIVMLRFYGNLTQAEIGARLGLSQMHVSRLLERALAYLRGKITEPA
jgi:RNA polymerase sigma-B factor